MLLEGVLIVNALEAASPLTRQNRVKWLSTMECEESKGKKGKAKQV